MRVCRMGCAWLETRRSPYVLMAMCEFTVLGEWMTAGEITRAAASIVASRSRDSFISPKRGPGRRR